MVDFTLIPLDLFYFDCRKHLAIDECAGDQCAERLARSKKSLEVLRSLILIVFVCARRGRSLADEPEVVSSFAALQALDEGAEQRYDCKSLPELLLVLPDGANWLEVPRVNPRAIKPSESGSPKSSGWFDCRRVLRDRHLAVVCLPAILMMKGSLRPNDLQLNRGAPKATRRRLQLLSDTAQTSSE